MIFELVVTKEHLKQVCIHAMNANEVMVDTEFVRIRTFYPKLGLIQLFDGEKLSLIDPIAIDDLSPFWELMTAPSVLKVFHACSEDLEVLQHYSGFLPTPMIDTQVMASFVGHGLSVGFAALVNQYLGVELDKAEARTDWCARPLTPNQLNYAAADVHYLLPLYLQLAKKLKAVQWEYAVEEECQTLLSKRKRVIDPDMSYLDIKNAWQLFPRQLAVLKALASWRYKEAQRRNLALNFVIKDVHLWKIVRFHLRSSREMLEAGISHFEVERHGSKMLRIIKDAEKIPESDFPPKIVRGVDIPNYKEILKDCRDVIIKSAEKLELPPELLGSKKQINQVIKWHWFDKKDPEKQPDILKGWRAKYLSSELNLLLDQLHQ